MPSGYVAGQKHARSVDKDKAIEAAIKRIQDGVEDQKNPSWVRAENSVKKSEIETCIKTQRIKTFLLLKR
jgi:hypothetical protein